MLHEQTAQLLPLIQSYCASHRMAESNFGYLAINDPRLVYDLRRGRRVGARVTQRIHVFMGLADPSQPLPRTQGSKVDALQRPRSAACARMLALAESYVHQFDVSEALFGILATGDGGLIASLRAGRDPRPQTQAKILKFIEEDMA